MRRLSTVASTGPKEGNGGQQRPTTSTAKGRGAAALKVHNYLSSCRVQRFNSKYEIVPLTITVRSDALFLCSDRDGAIHRVVPIVLVLSAQYYPYARKLHIAVSGEHDILLTATRLGAEGLGGHTTKVVEVIEEDDLVLCNVSGPSHSPVPLTREEEDAVDAALSASNTSMRTPCNNVSRTLERIAESVDSALLHASRDFGEEACTELSRHEAASREGTSEESSATRYRTISGAVLARRHSAAQSAIGRQRVAVVVFTDDGTGGAVDIAPQRCHLLKAMDYVSMAERLELRRRGSKRLVSVPRLTIEFWDACIALPPPPVSSPVLSDNIVDLLHGDAIVMKGDVDVIRIVKGLNATTFEEPTGEEDDGPQGNSTNSVVGAARAGSGRRMLLLATPRRLIVVAASGLEDGSVVMASVAVAAIHSIAVYSNTWPPRRMEVRYLGAGATPSSLDVSLPQAPSTPHGSFAGTTAPTPTTATTTTTTVNVVVVAEFLTRLAAREGVHVRMAQFNPPASDSVTQRLQRGVVPSSAMHPAAGQQSSSISTRLAASTSQFLQRARSFSPVPRGRSMSPDAQASNGSMGYNPSPAQSIAHTLAGGSETLKSAASSILYTISTGVHEAVNLATRRSPVTTHNTGSAGAPDPLARGGFDLAVTIRRDGDGGPKGSGAVGAFFSVPVTGRAASEARHASEHALKTKRSVALQRRSSLAKNTSGLSFSLTNADQKQQPTTQTVPNHSGSFTSAPASSTVANALRRPLPAVSGINDYCRPSVALRQAFDDGGVRKVLLARYAVRIASDEDVQRGAEKHAPRILVLSEHYNGADQRVVVADRRFVTRARLPYASVTRIEAFADDALKLTFKAHAGVGSPAEEEQVVVFVFDEKKHHSIGDHPATRLADIVSVMKQSLALTAEVFSYDYFSPHRAVAKTYMSGILAAASESTRCRPGTSEGTNSVDGRAPVVDARPDEPFLDVATLTVPRQYCLPDNAFPDAASVPASLAHLTAVATGADGPTHDIVYFQRIQRLSSNKSKWIDRMLVVLVPRHGSGRGGAALHDDGAASPRSEFELVLCDDNGDVHRRIEGRSILAINIVRDVVLARRSTGTSSAPQGCVMDVAVHGERRLIVRLVPCSSGVAPTAAASPVSPGGRQQLWVSAPPPRAPQQLSMLMDTTLPLALLPAVQLVNLLRRCCCFDFDESYDERRYWQPTGSDGAAEGGDATAHPSGGFHKAWSLLDPNEITFMDRRMSIMRLDYFSRTPRAAAAAAAASAAPRQDPTPCYKNGQPGDDGHDVATPRMADLNAEADDDATSNAADAATDPLQIVLEELQQRRGLHADWLGGVDALEEAYAAATEVVLLEEASRVNPIDVLCDAEQLGRSDIVEERDVYLFDALEEVWLESSLLLMSDVWQLVASSVAVANYVSPHNVLVMLEEADAQKAGLLTDAAVAMVLSEQGTALLEDEHRVRDAMATLESIRRGTKLHAAYVELRMQQLMHSHEAVNVRLAAEYDDEVAAMCDLWTVDGRSIEATAGTATTRCIEGELMHDVSTDAGLQVLERAAYDGMLSTAAMGCAEGLFLAHTNKLMLCAATTMVPAPVAHSTTLGTLDAENLTVPSTSDAEACLLAKVQLLHAASLGVWSSGVLCACVRSTEAVVRGGIVTAASVEQLMAVEEPMERVALMSAWYTAASGAHCGVQVDAAFHASLIALAASEQVERQRLCAGGMLHAQAVVASAMVAAHAATMDAQRRMSASEGAVAFDERSARAAISQRWVDALTVLQQAERLQASELQGRQAVAALENATRVQSVEEPWNRLVARQAAADAYNRCATEYFTGTFAVHGNAQLAQYCTAVLAPLACRLVVLDEAEQRHKLEAATALFYRHIADASHVQQTTIVAIAELMDEQERAASRIVACEELDVLMLFELIDEVWMREAAGRCGIADTHRTVLLSAAEECYLGAFSLTALGACRAWVWMLGLGALELQSRCSVLQIEADQFLSDIARWEPLHKRTVAGRLAVQQQEIGEFRALVGRFGDDVPKIKVLEFRRRLNLRQQEMLMEGAYARREALEAEAVVEHNRLSMEIACSCEQIDLMNNEALRRSVVAHEEDRVWAAIGSSYRKHAFFVWGRHRIREDEHQGRIALGHEALAPLPKWAQQLRCVLQEFHQRHAVLLAAMQDRQDIKQRAAHNRQQALQAQVMSDMLAGRQRQTSRSVGGPEVVVAVEGRRALPAAVTASTTATPPMPPPVSVGAGAGAAGMPTIVSPSGSSHTHDDGLAQPPPTKIRIKFGNSFLQMYVVSDDLLAKIVKRGRADMRAVNTSSPSDFCHCQCDRFRDVLMIRPTSLAQAFHDVRAAIAASPTPFSGASTMLATVEVRSSTFRWVPIPWALFFRNWLERSIEPVAQADDMMASGK